MPERIIARIDENQEIKSILLSAFKEGKGAYRCIYVNGPPGIYQQLVNF